MKRETAIWTTLLVIGGLALAIRAATHGMGVEYVKVVDGAAVPATTADRISGAAQIGWSRTIGVWVAAIFTLCIFSYLYKDNPLYKFAESVVVGVSAAYWMVVAFWTTLIPNLLGKLSPAWIQSWAMPGLSPLREWSWPPPPVPWYFYFLPLILCIMLLWRMMPTATWIARWPLAFIIGTTAGIRLVGFIQADFLSQIRNSIVPFYVLGTDKSFDFWASFRNFVGFLSVLACLVYFFFSVEHKGVAGRISKIGIWVLMITFGAAFGYTVMGRIALLAIRLEFLFDDWLWLIDPTNKRIGM